MNLLHILQKHATEWFSSVSEPYRDQIIDCYNSETGLMVGFDLDTLDEDLIDYLVLNYTDDLKDWIIRNKTE